MVTHLLLDRIRSLDEIVIAIDPGETIGWAVLAKGTIIRWGQIKPVAHKRPDLQRASLLVKLASRYNSPVLVMERFNLYAHKRKSQTNSSFPTVEVIGVIKHEAQKLKLPVREQSASQAKGLVPDKRLRELDFWLPGQRHARDAIRHALYYALTKKTA